MRSELQHHNPWPQSLRFRQLEPDQVAPESTKRTMAVLVQQAHRWETQHHKAQVFIAHTQTNRRLGRLGPKNPRCLTNSGLGSQRVIISNTDVVFLFTCSLSPSCALHTSLPPLPSANSKLSYPNLRRSCRICPVAFPFSLTKINLGIRF